MMAGAQTLKRQNKVKLNCIRNGADKTLDPGRKKTAWKGDLRQSRINLGIIKVHTPKL